MNEDPLLTAFLRKVWITDLFLPQIRVLREALLKHMLPALPDAGAEAKQLEQKLWEEAMSRPSGGDIDEGHLAEWVTNQAIDRYVELASVRQGATNMAAVMLWHLLEQQMLTFLRRELLTHEEAQEVGSDPNARNRHLNQHVFQQRLGALGANVLDYASSEKVDELRLVANVAKHAAGNSADQLHVRRPDLFIQPSKGQSLGAAQVAQPAAGEDLYLQIDDLNIYFDSAESFWRELDAQL